jgi:hypothetical protein
MSILVLFKLVKALEAIKAEQNIQKTYYKLLISYEKEVSKTF